MRTMKIPGRPWIGLVLLAAAAVAGCDSLLGPEEPASIEIRASRTTIDVPGDTVLLEAVIRAEDGDRISNVPVAWESMSPHVADVDQAGLLTAVANGSAMIVARAGGVEDSVEITVAAPIPCAPVGDLVISDTLPGSIEDGDCEMNGSTGDFWRVTLDRDTEVTLEMKSSELDAILVLFDEQGEVLEIDDDGGIGLNARIHRALGPGTYYLFLTSLFRDGRGPYRLIGFEGGYPSPCPATASVALPGTVTGTVTVGDCNYNGYYVDVWRLNIPIDTTVILQVGSAELVPLIAVADTLGEILTSSHFGPGGDAWLEILLPAGAYDLWIGDAGTRLTTGSYTLSTRHGPTLLECGTEGAVAVGDTVSGELTVDSCFLFYGAADGWKLSVEDSTTLEVTLEAPDLAPSILISDAAGELRKVVEGDESVASGEVSLEPGSYRVWARAAYERYGHYSLAVVAAPSAGSWWSPSGRAPVAPPGPVDASAAVGWPSSEAWAPASSGGTGKEGVPPEWLRREP